MELLAAWLKQIILVVLLATFIDLLLPNRTMQRYAKLVVSLFILMTILSPVLQLLGANVNLRMLAATVDGWSSDGTRPGSAAAAGGPAFLGSSSIPTLGTVLAEGEKLQRERDQSSLTLLAAKLEEMIVEHVMTHHDVPQATAKAQLALDADGMPVIRDIRIRIGNRIETTPEGGMRPIEPVEVEPVRVESIQFGGEKNSGDEAVREPEATPAWQDGATPVLQARERKAIAASVAAAWSIPLKRVRVEHAGETIP
jgi:stage III sporulation protein AF